MAMADDYVSKERALVIAQETANATVQQTMTALGIDMSTPESIIQTQVDFAFLRRQRRADEQVVKIIRRTAIDILVTGALALLWMGLKDSAVAVMKVKVGK